MIKQLIIWFGEKAPKSDEESTEKELKAIEMII